MADSVPSTNSSRQSTRPTPRLAHSSSSHDQAIVIKIAACATCSNPSKYTCPRCSIKTCSLACSKSHKTSSGCTGERDRTAYVPMNAYSWGTLADDYTYLEDIGRNVANWGRGIVNLNKGRGGRGPRGRSVLPPKCETLRVQLAARDIEIRFVPDGMEKRRLSQSSWDVRTKTAYLTVEFVFHLDDMEAGQQKAETAKSAVVSILTHRNNLAAPLAASLVSHLKHKSDVPTRVLDLMGISRTQHSSDESRREQKAENHAQECPAIPEGILFTISRLEKPSADAMTTSSVPTKYQAPALPIRVGPSHTMPSSAPTAGLAPLPPKPQKVFYPIDVTTSLQICLRNKSFIEWPTIDVFPSRAEFDAKRLGVLAENGIPSLSTPHTRDDTEEPLQKRRKTETGIAQLVGGYGEDSELDTESHGVGQDDGIGGIGALGGYESDEMEAEDINVLSLNQDIRQY